MNLYESIKRNVNESATKVYDYDDIEVVGFDNQFNTTVKQARIDHKNKTFKQGSFKIISDKKLTRKAYYSLLEDLKHRGYKELHNKGYKDLSESVEELKDSPLLDDIYNNDKKLGNVTNRLKSIEAQQRYDRLYNKYKDRGMSEEKIKSLLGERPVTGLENARVNIVKESSTGKNSAEEYWHATEIARDAFAALLRFDFGSDYRGNNYIITIDCYEAERFYADSDEEAIKIYEDWKKAKADGAIEYHFNNHYKQIAPRNMDESESTSVTPEEVRGDIFNCLEMYSEDKWNGSDDDYAQEVLEQNLYDAILAVVEKHLGLTFGDIINIPRESDPSTIIYNQFLDYVYAPSNKELDADEAIKVFVGMCNKVFNEYKAKNKMNESVNPKEEKIPANKEIARDELLALLKLDKANERGANYIITIDGNEIHEFKAKNVNEAKKNYKEWKEKMKNKVHWKEN